MSQSLQIYPRRVLLCGVFYRRKIVSVYDANAQSAPVLHSHTAQKERSGSENSEQHSKYWKYIVFFMLNYQISHPAA